MSAGFLIDVALKAMVVLAAAWAATRYLITRSSAAVRHLVWTVALITTVVLPAIVTLTPARAVPVLPTRWAPAPAAQVESSTIAADVTADIQAAKPGAGPSASATPLPSSHGGRSGLLSRNRTWPAVLIAVWAAGVAMGLLRLLVGLIWVSSISRRARPVSGFAWSITQADTTETLGVRNSVPVLISDHTSVPVACGILRPKVLLPRDAETWGADRRRVVLLHELAHVKRRDCLTQALAQLACALYWFNPLAFVATSRLHAEQERACDDLVLAAGVTGPEYADHLWEMVRAFRTAPFPEWATLAVVRPTQLEGRVRAILDRTRRRQPVSRATCTMAVAITLAGVVPLGALHVQTAVEPAATRLQLLPARVGIGMADVMMRAPINNIATMASGPAEGTFHVDHQLGNVGQQAPPLRVVDFSGTWIDDSGETLVITQTAEELRIENERAGQILTYELDGAVQSRVITTRVDPDGIREQREDTQTRWDGTKLITTTRPLWLWTPDLTGEPTRPQRGSNDTVFVRSLSADGTEMTVERIGFNNFGWDFVGTEPSQAYSRIKDVYIKSAP